MMIKKDGSLSDMAVATPAAMSALLGRKDYV
jgi:hypothetical protein